MARRKRETGGGFLCTTNGGQLDSPGQRLLINPMPTSKSTNIGGNIWGRGCTNIGVRNIEPKICGRGCQDLTFNWPASPPPRKMARIWLLRDYGDTDMERQRYNCCGIGGSGARDSVVSCSASWRGSQEERYELNSATYCPIVPLWPTYMGLVSVGG